MNHWWDANSKLTAVIFFSQCRRNGFAIRLHVGYRLAYYFLDAFERRIRCFCQPTQ